MYSSGINETINEMTFLKKPRELFKGHVSESDLKLIKVEMTPELAGKLLSKHNLKNRDIKESNVKKLTRIIKNGEWDPNNGETIGLSKDYVITNGQHRLLAIIRAGVTVEIHVMLNVSVKAIESIDTGSSRSAKDLLVLNNFKNASCIASIINLKKGLSMKHGRLHQNNKISNATILNIARENASKLDKLAKKASIYTKRMPIIGTSDYGAFYSMFSDVCPETAEDFFELLTKDVHLLPQEHPISVLQKILFKDKFSKSGKKYQPTEKRAMMVLCWNLYYSGKENVKRIKWDVRNSFPTVKGLDYSKYEENLF
jgi:hypothetical protein